MKKLAILIITVALLTSCSSTIDDIDGNTYNTVKINGNLWMKENLNVSHFKNGDEIPKITTEDAWAEAYENKSPAWCFYNFNSKNEEKYGKLYNFYAVSDDRGLAPEGWDVPNFEMILSFTNTSDEGIVDYDDDNALPLKSTEGWDDDGNGNNNTGFNALPSGYIDYDGVSKEKGKSAYFWSSSRDGSDNGTGFVLSTEDYVMTISYIAGAGYSVRCVKK